MTDELTRDIIELIQTGKIGKAVGELTRLRNERDSARAEVAVLRDRLSSAAEVVAEYGIAMSVETGYLERSIDTALSSTADTAAQYEAGIRERAIEECAKVAEGHIDAAKNKRLAKRHLKLSDLPEHEQAEVLAEERGENIAAEMIYIAIRNLSKQEGV